MATNQLLFQTTEKIKCSNKYLLVNLRPYHGFRWKNKLINSAIWLNP
jgi:hypothetical protein